MKYEQITELAAGYTISEDSTIDNGPFGFHSHHNYFRSPANRSPFPIPPLSLSVSLSFSNPCKIKFRVRVLSLSPTSGFPRMFLVFKTTAECSQTRAIINKMAGAEIGKFGETILVYTNQLPCFFTAKLCYTRFFLLLCLLSNVFPHGDNN